MPLPSHEPQITVGLLEAVPRAEVTLEGVFLFGGRPLAAGVFSATASGGRVRLAGGPVKGLPAAKALLFCPEQPEGAGFTLHNIAIGRSFHWERPQHQRFQGVLVLAAENDTLTVMNRVGLEQYLHSVICSEMNPGCPQEFLRAHCIISRSWLLAQLERKQRPACSTAASRLWTDAAVHRHFDVCADDHCQRYHGIAALNPAARAALGHTRGQVLLCGDEVCDARFSKCCGGITERFSTAWQDVEFEYLQPVTDAPAEIPGVPVPLMTEMDAERFIRSRPAAYCNVADRDLLSRILPDFDLETGDFFRWEVVLPQEKLRELLLKKSGIDFGCVRELRVLQRGASGRIMQLQVLGERAEKIFSKELAIRSALSTSHLYSSCFIVERGAVRQGVHGTFTLKGAGWGHGVGLCQIGAAAMAHTGVSCAEILAHYFKGTAIATLY